MSEYSLNLVVVKLNGEMCLFERKNGNAGLSGENEPRMKEVKLL